MTAQDQGDQLGFAELRAVNVTRCEAAFAPLDDWSLTDWALAVVGEAGELCNAVKKLRRGDGAEDEIAKELADVVIYCDLMAARLRVDLGAIVRAKFNEVSERKGCNIKLPFSPPAPRAESTVEAAEFRPTHRHYKGGLYQELMRGSGEETGLPVVIYRSEQGHVWVRSAVLFDGVVRPPSVEHEQRRFEPIARASLPPTTEGETTRASDTTGIV